MTFVKRRPNLWLPVATLNVKSSLWIKKPSLNNKSLKNKFMQNYGCSITTKKFIEKRLRLPRRKRKSMRLSIFLPGKTKTKQEKLRLPERRNWENKKCSSNNGQEKSLLMRRPIDKNSFWIESEILKLFNTTLLNVSSTESKMKPKSKEIKNCWLMLLLEKRHSKRSRKLRDKLEEGKLLSFNNTISKLLVTKKPTKN